MSISKNSTKEDEANKRSFIVFKNDNSRIAQGYWATHDIK